jgi:ABC-type protease/lipase transport system fused ATPase/permease subunit
MLMVMGGLDFIPSRELVRVAGRLDWQLNARVFDAIFRQRLPDPNPNRKQALQDSDTVRQFLPGSRPFPFFDAPWIPIYLLVIFLFRPLLGFIALGGAVVQFIRALFNEILTSEPLQQDKVEISNANAVAATGLRNAVAIAAMGMLPEILDRWRLQYGRGIALQDAASDSGGAISATNRAVRMLL